VEQKMLNPVSLGGILVGITPRWTNRDNKSGWLPDLRVSL
jgi:hypothetical protein